MALGFSIYDPENAHASTNSQTTAQTSDDFRNLEDDTIKKEYEAERIRKLRKSIEENNFSEFTQITRDTPFSGIITEEAFAELVSQYTLRTKGYHPTSPLDLE